MLLFWGFPNKAVSCFAVAGIPPDKVVEAHGTFFTSSCIRCNERYESNIIRKIIFSDKIPRYNKMPKYDKMPTYDNMPWCHKLPRCDE